VTYHLDERKDMRGYQYSGGWYKPRIMLQIMPLAWGLGVTWSSERVAVEIGPFAVAVEWAPWSPLWVFFGYFRDGWAKNRVSNVRWPKPNVSSAGTER
jgi:hypothetical protein